MADDAGQSCDPVLRIAGVCKRFGQLLANDDISLTLARGQVLALLGENGAGKSTLVSMLFGHYVPDAGSIEVFGRLLPPGDTGAALAAGIGMVHQHFTLAGNLSVLDNVLIGQQPLLRMSSGRGAMRGRLLQAARDYGLVVDPDARVGDLSVGERQRVEILKAVVRGARILILDEPTAVLTPQESESLFDTLRRFVAGGMSMIFISHKLDEVLRVSDRVAVLRAGKLVDEFAARGTSPAQLAGAMVGKAFEPNGGDPAQAPASAQSGRIGHTNGAPVLCLRDVTLREGARQVGSGWNLQVAAGEIVAIAGVAGNGQQPLVDLLTGLRAADSGRLTVAGRALAARPRDWIEAGVGRIPEDRVAVGVVGDMSLVDNAAIQVYRELGARRFGWLSRLLALLDRRQMRAQAADIARRFDVRHASLDQPIRMLSGGNIQKFILGRELLREPPLLIANQPTWGLDVGAVAWIHGQLRAARERGAAILLVSEELDEIFALADRVAVMYQGRLGETRPLAQWNASTIGLAMAGRAA